MGVVRSLERAAAMTRIGVGVFEAPCFPANSRILATWFPQQERARANAIYSFGQYVGLGFLSVPLFWHDAALRLARTVLHRRRDSAWRFRHGVVARSITTPGRRHPAPTAPSSSTSRPAAAAITEGQPLRFKWRHIGALLARPAGARRVDRTVRRQLDAGVFRHLVSDLSRHRARHDLHPGGVHDLAALHRRVGRRARRAGSSPTPSCERTRIGEPLAQAADRRRHAAGLDHRRWRTTSRPDETAW